jgi:hypothetical protein
LVLLAGFPSVALAWDGAASWYNPANGGNAPPGDKNAIMPGGGGIFGTGGARDYNITCANCHLDDKKQQGQIAIDFAFNPPQPMVNGVAGYTPGTTYTITATLSGEHLGLSGCGPYVTGNINNFAASFESSGGLSAGVLASDSGQSSANCGKTTPMAGRTTLLYGDCHAIFSDDGDMADLGRTTWSFSWTAPSAGAGTITMYYGAVDGDCMMDSFGDDVKTGNKRFPEATAALAPRPRPYAFAFLLLLPLALLWRQRRR